MRLQLIGKAKVVSILLVLVVTTALVVTACSGGEPSTYEQDRATQENILTRAQSAVPVYLTENFLARQSINEYMERLDVPGKLWYVYPITESGAYLGLYISRTYPLSIAVAMTNPQQVLHKSSQGRIAVPAPGIDGVFYNGVDPTLYYFFDATSDAMVLLTTDFVALDAPLNINVPVLTITTK